MPAMPRGSKKSQKIVERIIGKPENRQDGTSVYRGTRSVDGINRNLDGWYNHKV